MKPKSTLRSFLSIAGSAALTISYSHAATFYWDNNGTASGFGTAGGTWAQNSTSGGTSARWKTDATGVAGGSNTQTTTDADTFFFGDATNGLAAGTINVSGPVTMGNTTFGSASGAIVLSGGTINYAAASTITVNNTTNRIDSIIGGAATSLTKAGTGILILNKANTYAGTTIIKAGNLQLDFSITGAPTSNIISNSSVLSLGGGQLTVTGRASTTTSQTFASTSVTGGANTIANTANATANPQLVALGAITRSAGATLNFSLPTGSQTASNGITTSNTTTNGIIGGWATVGNAGWAGKTGDNITSGSVTYTTTATAGTTAANYTDNNIDVTNSAGLIDNVITPNSLRFNSVGAFTMTLAAGDNIIGSGGILVGTTVGNNLSTITGGNLAGSASGELIIHQHNTSNGLTIGSIIKNNGGATGLTKSGAGTLTLSGDNSYTGVTAINAGTLNISHANALGTTAGNTTIASTGSTTTGGRLQLGATSNTIFAENITITGNSSGGTGAINNSSQRTHTLSGNITLDNLTGGIRFDTNNSGSNLVFSGTITQTGSSQALILSTNASGGQNITVNNPIALNGGTLQVQSGGFSQVKGVNATDGTGIGQTLILAGGTLRLGVSNALNTTNTLTASGTFDLFNFNQTVNVLTGVGIVQNSVAGTRTLTVGNGGGTGSFSGTIVTGTGQVFLVKTGVGTQTLTGTNTSTGGTRIDDGTLTLGHATDTLANAGAVNVNGGTLDLGTNTDTVGAVTLTSGSITGSGAGELTGTGGSAYDVRSGSVSAKLGGSVGLTKTTGGTVTLSGANTYIGATTITTGTLQLDGSTHASSTVDVGTAGTLSGTGTVNGNATLTGSGIINKSSGTIAGTLGVTGGNWNGLGTVTGAVTSSSGTFTIGSGANLTASSGVSVTGGALVVNGTLTGTLVANSSTTVSGTGAITGNTTISGTHSPGNSPGLQNYGSDLSYTNGSSVTWELMSDAIGTRGTNFDGINVGGTLDFTGTTTLNLVFNFAGSTVDWADNFWDTSHTGTSGWLVYDVATNTTNFGNLSVAAANWFDGSGAQFNTFNGGSTFSLFKDGNDIYLNYNVVPEPRAALLGGLGLLMLLRRRRK